jgi:hypothetical protein
MHRLSCVALLVLAVTAAGWTPAPFPRPERRTPRQTMAGTWDVLWNSSGVRLDLHPDGSARFAYSSGGGTYEGSWRYEAGERRVILTLLLPNPTDYVMTFEKIERDAAEGKVRQGSSNPWAVSMTRAKQ